MRVTYRRRSTTYIIMCTYVNVCIFLSLIIQIQKHCRKIDCLLFKIYNETLDPDADQFCQRSGIHQPYGAVILCHSERRN